MRNLILSILLVVSFLASAQFKPTSFQAPPRLNISHIDNREFSTLVFLDYTVPDDSTWQLGHRWINFNDKTYISIPGSTKKYNMLSTVNMPIDSEAELKMMLFDHAGQRHQFVLEFEKLPEDCSQFDIIEDIDNLKALNIHDITFNPADSIAFINVDDFIADYPLKEYGQYYVNGTIVSYIKYKGIVVNAVANYLNQYGKYVNVNISVQNFRNRSILFNPANLSAVGYRYPKKKREWIKLGKLSNEYDDDIYADQPVDNSEDISEYDKTTTIPVDVELLTYEEYDRIVKKKQTWESFWTALGAGLSAIGAGYSTSTSTYTGHSHTIANANAYGSVGEVYGYVSAQGSSYTTTFGQTYTTTYNGLAQYLANQQVRAKMDKLSYKHSQIGQQIGEGYVKIHTIPAETEYSGFLNIKYNKKIHGVIFTIKIDGEPYIFYF